MTISFAVQGVPKGQPRPRAFAFKGKARVFDPGTAEEWESRIAEAARPHLPREPLAGPVALEVGAGVLVRTGNLRRATISGNQKASTRGNLRPKATNAGNRTCRLILVRRLKVWTHHSTQRFAYGQITRYRSPFRKASRPSVSTCTKHPALSTWNSSAVLPTTLAIARGPARNPSLLGSRFSSFHAQPNGARGSKPLPSPFSS